MSAVNPFTPPNAEVADVPVAHATHGELKFWSARGRIGRVRYIGWVMVGTMIGILAVGLASALLLPFAATSAGAGVAAGVVTVIGYIAIGLFCIFALIQRSHDMGWSGWTVLIAMFVPFAGFVWLFKSGTPGPNRYGAPPPPNSTGVVVAAWAALAIPFVVGILAAIALPAYQDYVKRAQAKQVQMQQAPAGQQQ